MIFDTDILIFLQRGNVKALPIIERELKRCISAQTYMELFQTAQNKSQHTIIHSFLTEFHFIVLPFSENISHRASVYIEQYALTSGLRAGDALIAATAVEHGLPLCSANQKHYKVITDLSFKLFKP